MYVVTSPKGSKLRIHNLWPSSECNKKQSAYVCGLSYDDVDTIAVYAWKNEFGFFDDLSPGLMRHWGMGDDDATKSFAIHHE
jgi:hypothetical protein